MTADTERELATAITYAASEWLKSAEEDYASVRLYRRRLPIRAEHAAGLADRFLANAISWADAAWTIAAENTS